ncbi:MAG: 6-phosphofructokinase [Candidatus Peregrinibacteria bacterium]|nr:6-phosphofructokinase [Candidatus Peregrinibacteria bacterium]
MAKKFEEIYIGETDPQFLRHIVQRPSASLRRLITKKGVTDEDIKKGLTDNAFTKKSRTEILSSLDVMACGIGLTGGGDSAGIADLLSSLGLNLDPNLTMLGVKNAGAGLVTEPAKFEDQLIIVDPLLAKDFEGQASTPLKSARVNAMKDNPENTKANIAPYKFVYGTGGDDHLGLLAKIAEAFPEKSVVGTFKSIDGDGCINGKPAQMLGFRTAMKKYQEDFWAIVQNAYTHDQVHVVEFFGRKSGKLPFEALRKFPINFDSLPREEKRKIEEFRDGILILVPEKPTSLEKIAQEVKKIKEQEGFCVVAVAEGFVPTTPTESASSETTHISKNSDIQQKKDSFGNIANLSGIRHIIISAIQNFAGIQKVNELLENYTARGATPTKYDSTMGKKIGAQMAKLINEGTTGGHAVVYFEGTDAEKDEPTIVPLIDVSNKNTLNNSDLYNDEMLRENGVFW